MLDECPKCGAEAVLEFSYGPDPCFQYDCQSYGLEDGISLIHESCECYRRQIVQLKEQLDLIIKQILPRIPESERWLWQNRKALLAVLYGCVQAAAGELSDGPDLEAGAKLIEDMEKKERGINWLPLWYLLGLLGGVIGIIALTEVVFRITK